MSALIGVINDFFCWFGSILSSPGGFLNSFINFLITSSAVFFPSTPQSVKLSSLLAPILSTDSLVAWLISQVLIGLSPALALYLGVTLWKMLPFT